MSRKIEKQYAKTRKKFVKRNVIIIVCTILLSLLGTVGAFAAIIFTSKSYNSNTMFKETDLLPGVDVPDNTPPPKEEDLAGAIDEGIMMYNGEKYIYNEDIVNLIFLGIDATKAEIEKGTSGYRADTIIIASINTASNEVKFFNIPRDTVTQITRVDKNNKYTGTSKEQIALAHAYGTDPKINAGLTVDAASNLMYQIPIYRYLSFLVDGIARATDMLGGVTITMVDDDLKNINKKWVTGNEVTLDGKDAELYLRVRDSSENAELSDNIRRVNRQMQFVKSMFYTMKDKVKKNPTFVVELFTGLNDYITSNVSLEELVYVGNMLMGADLDPKNMIVIDGEVTKDGYIVDEEALISLIRDNFYVKII